jgi:hypothetical protein
MPHDSKGQEIRAGDRVTVEFEVTSVSQNETACNVSLQAVDVANSGESYRPMVACNSKLVTKVALAIVAMLAWAGTSPAQHRCGGYSSGYASGYTYSAATYAAPTYAAPAVVVPAAVFVVPGSPTIAVNFTVSPTYQVAGYTASYATAIVPVVGGVQVVPVAVAPTPASPATPPVPANPPAPPGVQPRAPEIPPIPPADPAGK